MNLPNKWASDLLNKDRIKAQKAADHILSTPDIEAWKCLIDNSEYLFGYIKERAGQNLVKAANQNNIENIYSLLQYHSPDWDWCIAECIKNNSNDELKSKIFDLLTSGTMEEKSYAAKYFSLIKDPEAKEALFLAAQEEYRPLKNNAAEALGKINDQKSYNFFIEKLLSDDDWKRVEAAEFLANYDNKEAVIPILKAMTTSSMAEYIAGEAATLVNIYELLEENEETQLLALEAMDNIISGLAEVWGIAVILDFKLYDSIDKLIKKAQDNNSSSISGKYAQILLKAKSKITLLIENSQYTFDEEKVILSELEEIYHLLSCENEDFWNQQMQNINKELKVNDIKRKLAAITVINELELKDSLQHLIELLSCNNESEMVTCEAVLTIKKMGSINKIDDVKHLLSRITDPNLLAIIQNAITTIK
jgi:hypothetical protein